MRILPSLVVLFGIFLCTGCQGYTAAPGTPAAISSDLATPSPSTIQPDRSDRLSATRLPERIPPTEMMQPAIGEIPVKFLEAIQKDIADRAGVAINKDEAIRAQAIVWPDGSLGCPQPGVLYTQAPVNGYWVVFDVGGEQYDYRIADTGYYFLCESELPPVSPAGTPGS
jgi:hypothetical protein